MNESDSGLMALVRAEASMGAVGARFLAGAGILSRVRLVGAAAKAYRRGAPQECFRNAYELASKHSELIYCEGRALSGGIVPIEHAWCLDVAGNVIDNTWAEQQTEYLGVGFALPFLKSFLARRKTYGVLAEMFPVDILGFEPELLLDTRFATQERIAGAQEAMAYARAQLRTMTASTSPSAA
jgi:hypothetical protein